MKKRLLSVLLTLCMILTLLPISAFAAPSPRDLASYTVTIQAIVVDSDGKFVSANSLTSKDYTGTTNGGTSGGAGKWTWAPDGQGGYTMTAQFNSHANSWGNLLPPTTLWDYDTDALKLIGLGKNSYD